MIALVVVSALLVLSAVENVLERRRHEDKERELMNRLMARTYSEFAAFEAPSFVLAPDPRERRRLTDETGLIEVDADDEDDDG